MTFMPYGSLWRNQRRLLHQLTKPDAAKTYENIQESESAQLVRDLVDTPKNFWGHAQRYAGSSPKPRSIRIPDTDVCTQEAPSCRLLSISVLSLLKTLPSRR